MLNRILVVDDELENLQAIRRVLSSEFDIELAQSGKLAIESLERSEFAVILADQRLGDAFGIDVLARAAVIRPAASRLLLTAYPEESLLREAINRAEIYRFIPKPWDNDTLRTVVRQAAERSRLLIDNARLLRELGELNRDLEGLVARRTEELRLANQKLSELAMTDPLTRAFNRRALTQRLEDELERAKRYRHPLSVAMLDIDHFKKFNDMEGHLRGDEALRRISSLLASNLRRSDFLCRYGGEEFVIVMPETRLESAREICNRLRAGVEVAAMQGTRQDAYLTISIGIASAPAQGDTVEGILQSADQALYQAKEAGRNRVVVSSL